MEKLNVALVSLSLLFVFVLGFVVNNLYFNHNSENANQKNVSVIKQYNNKITNNSSQTISLDTNINSCVNNTKDNPQCKDCCDCLSGVDSQARTACRDTCAVHNFSKNTNIIQITVPSLLGKEGNYSECVARGSEECKTCCENQIGLQCGDYQYCRTACNNAFGDTKHKINSTAL